MALGYAAVVISVPPVPDLSRSAILLDIDGTLLDFASTPRGVHVPGGLRQTLRALRDATGGALALVSGRRVDELDELFAPLRLPAVGGHGAEIRTDSAKPGSRIDALDACLRRKIDAVAKLVPGIVVEDKEYAIAVHYRLAPQAESEIVDAVTALCAGKPSLELLPGKYVIEVKRAGFNKGTGVRSLMQSVPFAGRRPIFIGDDATDEYAFAIMPEFDGLAYGVGDGVNGAERRFASPSAVRRWLEQASHMADHVAP
jgi:trehalose 6-phosphate phosphatase